MSFTRFLRIKRAKNNPVLVEEDCRSDDFNHNPCACSDEIVIVEEMTFDQHMINIQGMTKLELDRYAEDFDIYLDRRRTLDGMISEFIEKLKEQN